MLDVAGRCWSMHSQPKQFTCHCIVLGVILGYHLMSIPLVNGCHWLLGVIGCRWVSLGVVIGCCWVSLGVVGCHWMLLGAVECQLRMLLGVIGCCWVSLDVADMTEA